MFVRAAYLLKWVTLTETLFLCLTLVLVITLNQTYVVISAGLLFRCYQSLKLCHDETEVPNNGKGCSPKAFTEEIRTAPPETRVRGRGGRQTKRIIVVLKGVIRKM